MERILGVSLFVILLALQLYALQVWVRQWLHSRHPISLALAIGSGTFAMLITVSAIEDASGLNLEVISLLVLFVFSFAQFALARGWLLQPDAGAGSDAAPAVNVEVNNNFQVEEKEQ